jgi:cobalt-zinc-cadmium resistance protein CzcA
MLSNIIRFSLKNKFLVLISTFGIVVWGIYSFTNLPIDAIPDITNNQVQILTLCPTLSTQEVEQFITMPIEQEVRNSPGMIELRSISRFGLSVITVVFKDNIPIYQARAVINERLQRVAEVIPSHFGRPEMAPISTGLGEILHYRLEALPGYEEKYPPMELRTIQDWIVKKQLSGIPGVVEINSFGGYLKQYEISVDPDKLRAQNISLTELYDAVSDANENTGGSYIEKLADVYFIRTEGLARNLKDIEQIVVAVREGVPVLVGDLASVNFGHAIRYGAVSSQAEKEIVLGIVMMLKDANAAAVIGLVKERMEKIKTSLPEGVTITTFLDREKLVNRTINTVKKNLLEGALIVILILVLLVGNLRAGLIIASVIPLSMLFAVSLMVQTGVTANLMSMGAIDFGLVVDGAVILVEATLFYLLYHYQHRGKGVIITQIEMDASINQAAGKVARSSVFGILIIIIVYLPIMSLTGIEGKMFQPMALTVTYALLGALILSLTYVPVISSIFLSKRIQGENKVTETIMHILLSSFKPFFTSALRRPRLTVGLSVGALIGAIVLFTTLGGEFIPELDEGDIMMHGFCKPGTSLTQTLESHRLAQKMLLDHFPNEVEQVISKIGTAEIPTDPMAIETADNIILLKPKSNWTKTKNKEELVEMMHRQVQQVPGMAFEFTQPIKMRFDEMMTGVRSDIAVKVFGDDLDTLSTYGTQLARVIGFVEGTRDIKVEQILGLPQLRIAYKYDLLARHGISIKEANQAVRIALAGESSGQIYENERRFELVVRLQAKQREDIEMIKVIPVRSKSGTLIPLHEIASIDFINGAAQISREDGQRRIVISANVRGRDVESVIKDIESMINTKSKLPPGYYIAYGGQFENLIEARKRLSIAVPAALILISILLFFAFKSVLSMGLILSAIPMASIGGVLALWARDMPFSISAGIGFIALFGVAVLNGIVLINYLNELEKEGRESILERVEKATMLRFRPVIMTAAVASFGFIPMAFSGGAGAEVQRPLATVVIGGLITSTMLTLLVLPALYLLVKSWQVKRAAKVLPIVFLLLSTSMFAQQVPLNEAEAIQKITISHPGNRVALAAQQEQEATMRYPVLWQPLSIYHGINADPDQGMFGTTIVGAEMTFPSFARLQSARDLQKARVHTSTLELKQTTQRYAHEIRSLYLGLSYNQAQQAIFGELDSLYTDLARIADSRYKAGETSPVESKLIEDKATKIRLEKNKLQKEYENYCQQLAWLTATTEPIIPSVEPLSSRIIPFSPLSTLDSTLVVQIMTKRMLEATYVIDVKKAQLKPEFSANLFGQYTANGRLFPGYTLSMQVPLFRKAYAASIQEADIGFLRAQATKEKEILALQQQVLDMEHNMTTLLSHLSFYNDQGLRSATELIRIARASYLNGASPYSELILALEQSNQTRLSYIEIMYQYSQLYLAHQLITQ